MKENQYGAFFAVHHHHKARYRTTKAFMKVCGELLTRMISEVLQGYGVHGGLVVNLGDPTSPFPEFRAITIGFKIGPKIKKGK